MRKLVIHRQFFINTDCYKAAIIQKPIGIQVHSTGSNNPYLKRYVQPDDGLLGKNPYGNDHNHPNQTVCGNAYIGKLNDGTPAIYQTLPWDYRCWLSGSGTNGNANRLGYIGYEICEDNLNNKDYFQAAVMGLSVNLDAYLCKQYNIPVDMIHDHKQLHDMGLASNHADIHHWLKKFNLTMDDYRNAVRQAMVEGVEVTYVQGGDESMDVIYKAEVIASSGNNVNLRAQPNKSSKILAKVPLKQIVDVLSTQNGWSKIIYQNITGYMMNEFLKKIDSPDQQPDTPSQDTDEKEKLKLIKQYLTAALDIINTII